MMRFAFAAMMLPAAAAAPTCTADSCCSTIVYGKCTGNTHAAPATTGADPQPNPGAANFVCATQTNAGSYADKTTGNTIDLPTGNDAVKITACCDAVACTASLCGDGYTLTSPLASITAGVVPTEALCCTATTGMCAGNQATAVGIAAQNDDDTTETVGLVDGFHFDCTAALVGTAATATTINANSYANKANGDTITLAATVTIGTATEVDTAVAACCDAVTCDTITCPTIEVKKAAADQPAAGVVPTQALCCEAPSTGYCTDLKDGEDTGTALDTFACAAGTYAVQITAAAASCTGTATDTTKICDLDATTDSSATCPIGCTSVSIGDVQMCPEPPAAEAKTSGAATAAPLAAVAALVAALA